MKRLKISLLAVLLAVVSSCTNNFDQINTNPNQPEEVSADLLLSKVISNLATEMSLQAWNNGNITAQYTAKINFTGFDRYLWGSESGFWNMLYGNMRDVNNILEISRAEGMENATYEAIALTLKAYIFSNLTDSYGDVPYSQAIKGKSEGIFTPVYDTQEAIYDGILADLEMVNTLLQGAPSIPGGDLIYGGDPAQWRKLANSLRLRYLLRISGKRDVSADMQAILNSEPIIASNADNAMMEYLSTQPNTWPVHTYRIGSFDEYRLSLTMESALKGLNDNRLFTWFRPTDATINSDEPIFAGMPNGLSENNASTYNGGALNVSRCGSILYEEPNAVDAVIMQYAEVQFILAEAAQKGLISGDAAAFYENGVKASFEYWNVEQDLDTYLAQEGVAYDGNLETIMTQKWLSFFLVGQEAWYEYRRTGLPSFIEPGPDNVNDNRVPVRFFYPDDQQTLNGENYQEAVSRIGGDDINTKGWWESE